MHFLWKLFQHVWSFNVINDQLDNQTFLIIKTTQEKRKNLIFDGDGGVGVANCPTCRWSLYCHLDFWCWCCIESWCLLSSPPTGSRSPNSSLANCTSSGRRPRPCKPKLFHPKHIFTLLYFSTPVRASPHFFIHTFYFLLALIHCQQERLITHNG